jgi:hypothetical protein
MYIVFWTITDSLGIRLVVIISSLGRTPQDTRNYYGQGVLTTLLTNMLPITNNQSNG